MNLAKIKGVADWPHCYVHMCQDCIEIESSHLSIMARFFLTLALVLRLLYYFHLLLLGPLSLK